MDIGDILNTLANQVAFWQKDNPASSPALNSAKGTIRDTGRMADAYVGGGMGKAALRGPDALSRQIALNAALMLAGEGVGYGLDKGAQAITPKIEALIQWIKPKDIGIHISPFSDIPEVLPNINTNLGAGEIPNYPLVKGQTYKFSSKDYLNNKITPHELIDSAEKYIGYLPQRQMNGTKSLYITKSPLGNLDPETQILINNLETGNYNSWKVPSNGRVTPRQEVIGSVQFTNSDYLDQARKGYITIPPNTPVLTDSNRIPEQVRNDLVKFIEHQRLVEKMKSILKGTAVGGSAVGATLTPIVAAKPALGLNKK